MRIVLVAVCGVLLSGCLDDWEFRARGDAAMTAGDAATADGAIGTDAGENDAGVAMDGAAMDLGAPSDGAMTDTGATGDDGGIADTGPTDDRGVATDGGPPTGPRLRSSGFQTVAATPGTGTVRLLTQGFEPPTRTCSGSTCVTAGFLR